MILNSGKLPFRQPVTNDECVEFEEFILREAGEGVIEPFRERSSGDGGDDLAACRHQSDCAFALCEVSRVRKFDAMARNKTACSPDVNEQEESSAPSNWRIGVHGFEVCSALA
jgi:hypothetical protein